MNTAQDLNEILDASIDLENGFRRYLLHLRPRLTNKHSQQTLDLIMRRIFKNPTEPATSETYNGDVPVYYNKDFPVDYDISCSAGPRELTEKILEHEGQHHRFYNGLEDLVIDSQSEEIFILLVRYKARQIRETKIILDGMGLAV